MAKKKSEDTKEVDPRMKLIGARITELRKKAGYSSGENFSTDHSLGRMAYWRAESGTTNITMKSLFAILDAHGITIREFFLEINEPKRENPLSNKKG